MTLPTATLMTWHDSNMAGDDWTWRVFVTRRANGSYSVGARQDGGMAGSFRLRGRYGLRSGKGLLDAIEALFMHDVLQAESPDWGAIVRNARRFDPALGQLLQQALKARAERLAREAIAWAQED